MLYEETVGQSHGSVFDTVFLAEGNPISKVSCIEEPQHAHYDGLLSLAYCASSGKFSKWLLHGVYNKIEY